MRLLPANLILMRAAYLVRPGVIEIRDLPVPVPGPGEVVLRVAAALTCGTDLKAFRRGHALIPMPGPFGHEFSGIVHEAGPGVRRFRKGDAVMAVHSAPCRSCDFCARGLFNLCESVMDTKVLGAFAEYVLLPAHIVRQNAFHKPPRLSFDEAAMLEPLACIVHPYGMLPLRLVQTALVIGAGPIGLLHALYLRHHGVSVIVSDVAQGRLRTARALGAVTTGSEAMLGRRIREATGGTGVDLVVECTGQPAVWEQSVSRVRRGGTVILFGGCRSGTSVCFDTHRLHYDEVTLAGSFHFTPADVRHAYRLLAGRRLKVSSLLSGSVGLERISSAFRALERGAGIKYVVRP